MNASPSRPDPAVDERAAYWAARLEGEPLQASERAELDVWLATSAAHRVALSEYCQLSADLEEQLPALVATGRINLPQSAPAPRFSRWPRLAVFMGAAAALVLLTVWLVQPKHAIENLATAVAQRSSATLADGTRVELNAHTSLRFENSGAERRVRLVGGEAIFTVAKDLSRPFIVETPAGSVRVTGTAFNLRHDPTPEAGLEVTVIEGSVEVRPAEAGGKASPHALVANDQLTLGASGAQKRQLSDGGVADVLAWREGRIVFDGVRLAEVASRFGRYHGRRITLDAAIADTKVGGVYSLDDFHGFLRALEGTFPLQAQVDAATGTVLMRARTEN